MKKSLTYLHSEKIHNKTAAEIILPKLFQIYKPNSILDIGCGLGTWLSAAKEMGVSEVMGIDGDYVNKEILFKYIQPSEFIPFDLRKNIDLGKKFDLCICLEVAEHLPANSSDTLIESLVRHSDSILFSAAIPGQGGQNHVNEQWASYWVGKFGKHGFKVYDPIRYQIWDNSTIEPWYKQNLLLFSKSELNFPEPTQVDLIHPDFFKREVFKSKLLKKQLQKIIEGKKGTRFYLKRVLMSIFKVSGK